MHGGFGTGTVDLKSVLDALEGSNFSGSAILEIISSDPLEDFKESLERIAAACTGTI
jgi:sugar phosphate isomerase/epimerase